MSNFAKIVLALAFAAAVFFADPANRVRDIGSKLAGENVVVMYSLTTCPYCKQMRALLTRSGIPFTEYFIDTDAERMQEFNQLLAASGALPGSIGTPTFLVNNVFLPNNPGLDVIKRNLKFKPD